MRLPLLLLATVSCFAATPDEAFKVLMDGNQRFLNGKCNHTDRCSERLEEMTQTHEPWAIIVGCADARVGPDLIFDQGIGDLFIVRVAGNVVGPLELESIHYAAQVLKAPLILVMGHQNCGAVQAVYTGNAGSIPALAKLIAPAIKGANNLENAIKANAKSVAEQLRKDPPLAKLMQDKKLLIKQGYYNFTSGAVEILN